jgi:hypothetical protein
MRKVFWIFAIVVCTALASPALRAESIASPGLVMTTVAEPPPGSTQQGQGFPERVAREAFRRIGREIEVNTLPGERSLTRRKDIQGPINRRKLAEYSV